MSYMSDIWKNIGVITPIVIFFVLQTGTAIWWASNVTGDLKNLNSRMDDYCARMDAKTADRFTKTEAVQWFALRDSRIDSLSSKVDNEITHISTSIREVKNEVARMNDKLDSFLYRELDKKKR